MPTTTGMKGDGFYDRHSTAQRAALEIFLPWLEEAMDDLPSAPDPEAPISIMDIGSSEGANAVFMMNHLIQRLRTRTDRPIQAFFDDLPTNNFNQLFANLSAAGQSALQGGAVYPYAVGGSAIGRLVPSRSLHVATTFNAIGFLENHPATPLPNYILPMDPGPNAPRPGISVTDAEREPYRIQAAGDLERFLLARSAELVPGGKLLMQVFGRNTAASTSHGIYDVISDALLDLVENSILPRQVYENLVFPIYFRTIEELTAPLHAHPDLSSAFRIEHAEAREVEVPFNGERNQTGDLAAWAASYTHFLRAFTESIVAKGFPESLQPCIDRTYRRVEERLVADPDRYHFRYISVATLLTRT